MPGSYLGRDAFPLPDACRVGRSALLFCPKLVRIPNKRHENAALGIMFLIQISTTNPYVTNGINFTLPYLSLSLALNIILTIAIVLRLLTFRRRVVTLLGSKHGSQYTSIAAMIVESAALYSTVSFTFLVLFGIGNAVSQVFIQSLSQFQVRLALLGNASHLHLTPNYRQSLRYSSCSASRRVKGGLMRLLHM